MSFKPARTIKTCAVAHGITLRDVDQTLFSSTVVREIFQEAVHPSTGLPKLPHAALLFTSYGVSHYIIAKAQTEEDLIVTQCRGKLRKVMFGLIETCYYKDGVLNLNGVEGSDFVDRLKKIEFVHQDIFAEQYGSISEDEEEYTTPAKNLETQPAFIQTFTEAGTEEMNELGAPSSCSPVIVPIDFEQTISLGKTKILKEFPCHGFFVGTVVSKSIHRSGIVWTVLYSDADEESMMTSDLFQYVSAYESAYPSICLQENISALNSQTAITEQADPVLRSDFSKDALNDDVPSKQMQITTMNVKEKGKRIKRRSAPLQTNSVTPDIGLLLQQHILKRNPVSSGYCALGFNCLEAQNDDNLKHFDSIGKGRSLAKQLPRTSYYCKACFDSKSSASVNEKLYMCRMCYLLVHAQQGIWTLGEDTAALARLMNTKEAGIVELEF